MISTDTKKLISNFFRESLLLAQDQTNVNDHDFGSLAEGIAIPHGLYDIRPDIGHMTIGNSHDTSEFSCECVYRWRKNTDSSVTVTPIRFPYYATVAEATIQDSVFSNKKF